MFLVSGEQMPIHIDLDNCPSPIAEENTRKIHHGHIVVEKVNPKGVKKFEFINEDVIPDLNSQAMTAAERHLMDNMSLIQRQRDKRNKENRMEALKA